MAAHPITTVCNSNFNADSPLGYRPKPLIRGRILSIPIRVVRTPDQQFLLGNLAQTSTVVHQTSIFVTRFQLQLRTRFRPTRRTALSGLLCTDGLFKISSKLAPHRRLPYSQVLLSCRTLSLLARMLYRECHFI